MNLKKVTKAFEKKAGKHMVKGGMGIGTTIASKHSYQFYKRFQDENAQVLKEVQEEMARIREKKKENYFRKVSRKMRQDIPKAQRDEWKRQQDFIKSIK